MSTGRHAGDTASQHQPREMHDPALCWLEAAAPPPHTHQMQQDADVSRWIPGNRPGAAEAAGQPPVPAQAAGQRPDPRSRYGQGRHAGIASDDPDGHRAEHALHTRSHMLGGDRHDLIDTLR